MPTCLSKKKYVIFSLILLFMSSSFFAMYSSGFDGNTLIMTSTGRFKPIKELNINEEVVCYNNELQQEFSPIKSISAITGDCSIEITTQDDVVLSTSITERFYLPVEKQWVFAQSLKVGDCLLNHNLEAIAITSIKKINEPKEFLVITVEKNHNFVASSGGYIVHNGPWLAWAGYWATKALCYGTAAAAAGAAVTATGGGAAAYGTALLATYGTSTATMGAAAVANCIGVAAATEGAAITTTAVLSSAGSFAAANTMIE